MRAFLLNYGIVATYLIIGSSLLYLFILAVSHQRMLSIVKSTMNSRFRELAGSEYVPPVSILVPSYNEELTIIESVHSLMTLEFPGYEVVVINDGSADRTLQVLLETFDLKPCRLSGFRPLVKSKAIRNVYKNPLYPRLVVIDKANGGKADALNAGINAAKYPLVATIDADSLLEKDALIRLVNVYMENPEQHIAIGGNVRIANGSSIEDGRVLSVRLSKKWLPAMQYVEYVKAFLGGRIGWSAMNGLLIVSGAFGLFRKDYLVKVGGYEEECPGEDMNIVMKLHKYMLDRNLPYRIVFCPDAVCWTQAPDTLQVLGAQRRRWIRGSLWNVSRFRAMLFIPKYKVIGWLALPYTILYEILSPFVRLSGLATLVGYVLLDMTQLPILLIFLLVNLLIGMVFTCGSLLIEAIAFRRPTRTYDLLRIIGLSVVMTVGYDQINALWKLLGQWDYLRRNNAWGNMVRRSWQDEAANPGKSPSSHTKSTKAAQAI
ncbi:Glycosyltransferase, catalytic subunit of cellulose synthase and poly-beta-1,6-N-acetylglucosamine synthase [Paenibacillus sp. yr247]|uniref:glycosyltransferase family 2 protein n=1 Tax=Paenibacillus sp. yr247 TaxID=1761880 RepID=UPI000891B0A7|nr:glycosyltransferase family 2 protein [Paenibacillus sp. yr247]SDO49169.1 Glycosyltransferase, catalytic subunit of cellulose synthase and poly-beta-1,6-N-acetylglucosamine synthase [Paenibacillus sp. yr247]